MFYEEKIINGVMHWRSTPGGEWERYTLEQLTERYAAEKRRYDELSRAVCKLNEKPDITIFGC